MGDFDPLFVESKSYKVAYSCCGGRGLLYVRKTSKKDIFQIRLRVRGIVGPVVRSTGTTIISEAFRFAEDLNDDLKWRIKEGLSPVIKTFAEFMEEEWLPYAKATLSIYRYRLHTGTGQRYFIPYFGHEKLDEIRQKKVDNYWAWRRDYWVTGIGKDKQKPNIAERPSVSTLKMERSLLNQIFRHAKRQEYVLAIPLIEITKSKNDTAAKVRPFFSPDDYDTLLEYMETWKEGGVHSLHRKQRQMIRLFTLFLFMTGMRPAEAISLKWKYLLDPRHKKLNQDFLHIYIPKQTKTGSRVTVPMEGTDLILDQVREISDFTEDEDQIWIDYRRQPLTNSHKTFEKMLKKAEVDRDMDGQKRTYYSCRHSHISFKLLKNEVPPDKIAVNCGTSEKEIRKHYNHISAAMLEHLHATGREPDAALGNEWGGKGETITPATQDDIEELIGVRVHPDTPV